MTPNSVAANLIDRKGFRRTLTVGFPPPLAIYVPEPPDLTAFAFEGDPLEMPIAFQRHVFYRDDVEIDKESGWCGATYRER